jgi:hypothetical protein
MKCNWRGSCRRWPRRNTGPASIPAKRGKLPIGAKRDADQANPCPARPAGAPRPRVDGHEGSFSLKLPLMTLV